MAATLYAIAPLMIHGYTWPQNDDPQRLQAQLDAGIGWWGYYGHLPAYTIGMAAYYWLTPVIVYLGLWAAFSRYGWQTPIMLWTVLFGMARPLLFDLWAGTFIQQIGVYGLALPLMRLGAARPSWLMLAPVIIAFHTVAGVIASVLALVGLALNRKWQLLALLGVGIAGMAGVSWLLFGSSLRHLGRLASGQLVAPMPLMQWLGDYVGPGMWLLLTLGIGLIAYAWRRGWRPQRDGVMVGLLALVPPLAMLVFVATSNPDRPAKLLVECLILLVVVGAVDALKQLRDLRLTLAATVVLVGVATITAPDIISYWLGMGVK